MLTTKTSIKQSASGTAEQEAPTGAHEQEHTNMDKRALLIAFHFPPQAASSGIQRTLSFSKHLGKYGWEPIVLSAHPRAYSVQNPSQLAHVPANLVVRRAFALDAKHHMGIKGRYPQAVALPDRWITWWLGAVPAGLALIRKHRPQVIWSTFPISTAHLIGLTLHRLTGLPWVADFRDPMIQPSYPSAPIQRKMYQWIERQTIKRCSMAVFTTHSAMNAYRERFPEIPASKFHVIENGYDEDGLDLQSVVQPVAPAAGRPVTLVHSGVLYQSGRDPSAFLKAIANLKKNGQASAATLRVVLRAPGEMVEIAGLVRNHGVEDIVEVAPPVPYRDALHEMLAADGLLVFQGTPFNTQIPAKIYEYFRARKPIMGLVDTAGETARVLRAAGFETLANMDRADAIAPMLAQFIGSIGRGEAYVASDELIAASSRTHRASQLADVLSQAALSHTR
ncbi:MAG: glycosyltransferase [Massilia sp.]